MFYFIRISKHFPAVIVIALSLFFLCNPAAYTAEPEQGQTHENIGGHLAEAVEMIGEGMHERSEAMLLDIVERDSPERNRAYILLGRIYKETGDYKSAEEYLTKAADAYPLLGDYALRLLTEVYAESGQYEKVIQIAKRIRNSLLLQEAKKSVIGALFALEKEDEAVQALSEYVVSFPEDLEYKLALAGHHKMRGEKDLAVKLYKDIYISAGPESEDAYSGLKELKADFFTDREIRQRAENLFKTHNYREAEDSYRQVLAHADSRDRPDIIYRIAMSQFRQKKYSDSAGSFGRLGGPKSMYYRARSFYRINDRRGFLKAKKDFEKRYPRSKHLAFVYLMEAEEYGRQGRTDEAERSYRHVIKNIPEEAEAALWGLGWMNYTQGDYNSALGYFSRLAYYTKSREYYKYLYWKARTSEKLNAECIKKRNGPEPPEGIKCDSRDADYFKGLPSNESYYGYLIKQRSPSYKHPGGITVSRPPRPEGRDYERIDALSFLGFREEAVGEIIESIKHAKKRGEFLYLGYMAAGLDEYKSVIAFAEPSDDREFLQYSYPLAFWDAVTNAAAAGQVDAHLVAALIREESRFDPEVVSWAGAVGLMQLLPSTAHRLKDNVHIKLENDDDLKDVRKNVLLGTYYLSKLINEFRNVPLAIAAYNAGENRVRSWLSRFDDTDIAEFIENIPYRETRRYVKKVLKSYWQYRTVNGLRVKKG